MIIDKDSLNSSKNAQYTLFVGNKYSYFKDKWLSLFKANSTIDLAVKNIWRYPSFNLWAGIFGPVWFLYRKMYWVGFTWICLSELLPDNPWFYHGIYKHGWYSGLFNSFLFTVFSIKNIVWIVMTVYANAIYLRHTSKSIEDVKNQTSEADSSIKLSEKGGTSMIFVIYYLIVAVAWNIFTGNVAYTINWFKYALSTPKEEIIINFKANLDPAHDPEEDFDA